jgi:hypothetical protein
MSSDGVNEILLRIRSVGGKKAAAEVRELGAAGKEAGEEAESFGSKVTNALGKASNVAMFATLAVGADVVRHAVGDAMKLETITNSLHQNLQNAGQLHASTMKNIEAQTERISTHGGFENAEELEGINKFVLLTHKSTVALKDQALAVGIARGMHMELAEAQKIVSAGQAGLNSRVEKYLGVLPIATKYLAKQKEAEKALNFTQAAHYKELGKLEQGEINRTVTEKWAAKQRAVYNKTLAGEWSNLTHMVNIFYEHLGQKIIPKIQEFFSYIAKHKSTVVDLAIAIGSVVAILDAYWVVMKVAEAVTIVATVVKYAYAGATWAAAVAQGFFDAACWGSVVVLAAIAGEMIVATAGLALLAYGIYYVVTHWKQFKGTVMEVWSWIKGHWPLLTIILLGPIGFAVIEIVKHFKVIRSTAEEVFGGIANVVKTVFGGIVWVVSKYIGFIKKEIRALMAAVQPALKAGGWVLGELGKVGGFAVGELGKGVNSFDKWASAGEGQSARYEHIKISDVVPALSGAADFSGSLSSAPLMVKTDIHLDAKKVGEHRRLVEGVEARQREKHHTK